MKKRILIYIVCLITAFLAVSGCVKEPAVDKKPLVDVEHTETPLPVINSVFVQEQPLVCGEKFTLGTCISGDLLFTGNNATVFRGKDELLGASALYAGTDTVAAVMKDGTVRVVGESEELYKEAEGWKGITKLAFGFEFLLGLRSDGTVAACGKNVMGRCDTDDIRQAVDIAAGKYHAVVLRSDGTVESVGAYAGIDDTDTWTDIKEIACGDTFTVGLRSDGTVVSYHADAVKNWRDVHGIQACGKNIAAFTKDGGIISTADFVASVNEIKPDAFCLSNSFMVLRDGDSVYGFGDNDNLQCDTSWWDMGLAIGYDGYITGLAEGMDRDEVQKLLSAETGKQVTLKDKDGKAFSDSSVGTGVYAVDENGHSLGVTVLYGDSDGNGIINPDDITRIKKHMDGEEDLYGAYAEAAHTLHHISHVKDISEKEISQLQAHIEKKSRIRQFVHDPYASDIRRYHRINDDVVGFIRVDGTRINYPIMYGGKNYYYHNHTIYGGYSGVGSIYSVHSEYKKNNVVLGHNARGSHGMFYGLHIIQNMGEELLVFKNRVFDVTIYGEYSRWEVFAFYETGPDEPIETQQNNIKGLSQSSEAEIRAWIDGQIERSELDLGVEVSTEDTLLTLYTCGDKYYSDPDSQSRLYLFLRRVG